MTNRGGNYGFQHIFTGPVGKEKERAGFASEGGPINTLQPAKIWRTEGKGTAIKKNGSP